MIAFEELLGGEYIKMLEVECLENVHKSVKSITSSPHTLPYAFPSLDCVCYYPHAHLVKGKSFPENCDSYQQVVKSKEESGIITVRHMGNPDFGWADI